MRRVLVAAFLVLISFCISNTHACTTVVVGRGVSQDGTVFAAHSNDGDGGIAANLELIPAATHHTGDIRNVSGGAIPQVANTYAYLTKAGGYAALNEYQVGLAESTCVAKLQGSSKGKLNIVDLSAIALERSKTARDAIQVMGTLAQEFGYNDNGESLLVVDPLTAFIFHVLPDDTGASAVWVAQRVPDSHVAVVANSFIIRDINFTDTDTFMYSSDIKSVAHRAGFWKEGENFDFVKVFSGNEPGHKYYSGRRMWYAYKILSPQTTLPSTYNNFVEDTPYPTTIPALPKSANLTRIFRVMRSWYQGTEYDMGATLSGGAFGTPDRWSAGAGENMVQGAWERNIAISRSILSYVIEVKQDDVLEKGVGGTLWVAPHASHTSLYVPFKVAMLSLPKGYTQASTNDVGRGWSAWQASRFVFNIAQIKFMYMIKDIAVLQHIYENRSIELINNVTKQFSTGKGNFTTLTSTLIENAELCVAAWWNLSDALLLHYADGYCNGYPPCMSEKYGTHLGYPAWWLKAVNYTQGI
eukprot:m.7043 g.7043  ORF g.7043 m.7043 type:complete len:527 (+) comp3640_c0_seq1:313-1893(+)